MNPLSLLADLLPAVARRYVYAITAAALFIYGIWEVSAGDLRSFLVAVGSALVASLAAANTPAPVSEVAEAAVEMIDEAQDEIAADEAREF